MSTLSSLTITGRASVIVGTWQWSMGSLSFADSLLSPSCLQIDRAAEELTWERMMGMDRSPYIVTLVFPDRPGS